MSILPSLPGAVTLYMCRAGIRIRLIAFAGDPAPFFAAIIRHCDSATRAHDNTVPLVGEVRFEKGA